MIFLLQVCYIFVSYADYIVNLELCMALLQLLRIADNQVKTTICQQVCAYVTKHYSYTFTSKQNSSLLAYQ